MPFFFCNSVKYLNDKILTYGKFIFYITSIDYKNKIKTYVNRCFFN